jgi:predicted secreted acid phosphatase
MEKFILIVLFVFVIFLIISNKKENFMQQNDKNNKNDKNDKNDKNSIYKVAANLGITYLDKFKNFGNKPAVMFDIDDTLLFVDDYDLTPITPIIDLLNYCITLDLLIIIITARSEIYRTETIKQLNKFGINYSYVYLRKSPEDDNSQFKSKVKQRLLENYDIKIIMSIGDQMVDIVGDYSGYCLKLPNRIKNDQRLYEKLPGSDKLVQVI